MIVTGVPGPTWRASQLISGVGRRTQPCEPVVLSSWIRPCKRDLSGAAVERVVDGRAGAQRERVGRSEVGWREGDGLLDEELAGRRRRRGRPDGARERAHGASVEVDGDASRGEVYDDVPGRVGVRRRAGADPADAAVRAPRQADLDPAAEPFEDGKHGVDGGDRRAFGDQQQRTRVRGWCGARLVRAVEHDEVLRRSDRGRRARGVDGEERCRDRECDPDEPVDAAGHAATVTRIRRSR